MGYKSGVLGAGVECRSGVLGMGCVSGYGYGSGVCLKSYPAHGKH